MHKLKGYLPFLLVMIPLGLVLLFPSVSFTYIFQPIAVLFWAAWRMLLSVNQNVYWLLLLIMCGLLIGRALMPEKKTVSHPAYDYKTSPPDRVEYRRAMIQKTTPGEGSGDDVFANADHREPGCHAVYLFGMRGKFVASISHGRPGGKHGRFGKARENPLTPRLWLL